MILIAKGVVPGVLVNILVLLGVRVVVVVTVV